MFEVLWKEVLRAGPAKALALAMCAYSILFAIAQGGNYSHGDERMRIADSVLKTGGFAIPIEAGSESAAIPSRSQPPGIVLVFAALGELDQSFASGLACAAKNPKTCPSTKLFFSLIVVQAIAGLGLLFLVYRLFVLLSLSKETAFFALLLFVFTFRVGDLIRVTTGQIIEATLLLAHITLCVDWYVHRKALRAVASGAFLGLACLCNPLLFWMLAFEIPLLVWSAFKESSAARRLVFLETIVMAGACVLVLAPWSLRNLMVFGDLWLTSEGDVYGLAARCALNTLEVKQWILGGLRWLPGMSDDLAGLILPTSNRREFAVFPDTTSFARLQEILSAGNAAAEVGSIYWTIFSTEALAQAGRHVLVTPVLFLRGVFSGLGIFGLFAVIAARPVFRIHQPLGRAMPVLLVLVPILGLALVQSVITPNEAWRNLLMPLLSSYIIASLVKTL